MSVPSSFYHFFLPTDPLQISGSFLLCHNFQNFHYPLALLLFHFLSHLSFLLPLPSPAPLKAFFFPFNHFLFPFPMTFYRLSHYHFLSCPFPLFCFSVPLTSYRLYAFIVLFPNVISLSFFPHPLCPRADSSPLFSSSWPALSPFSRPSSTTAQHSPSPACSPPGASPLIGTCYGSGRGAAGPCICLAEWTEAAVCSRTAWVLQRRKKYMWKEPLT